jgi:hypothetical protein
MTDQKLYSCKACGTNISHKMWLGGLRAKGESLCLACQVVRNEYDSPKKLADFINAGLIRDFKIDKKLIDSKRSLDYWMSRGKH